MELTWSAMRCSLRRILPSPARMSFERTDTGAGLLAGRAWAGAFRFALLSNGHRMRGPPRVGRPAHPLQRAQRPGLADGAAYRRRITRTVIGYSPSAKRWRRGAP